MAEPKKKKGNKPSASKPARENDLFAGDDVADELDSEEVVETNGDAPSLTTHPHASGPLGRMMDDNFLQYASYVICERAIPSLVDGFKPVQRRIMHALFEKDDGRFIKVANVVGHTMQYHPHGDASIGDALVTLTNKGYLIEGQGNFGNIFTGNAAAAPRYIECRLTELARREVFNKDLTEFIPSYDGRNKEPVVLPTKLPLLLMLGAEGIAVGLSTRILPHNFVELIEAQICIMQKKPFEVFPDFPQGGLMDTRGMVDGNGSARVRACIDTKRAGALVINELPAATTTESLITGIEEAIRKHNLPIKSISDFTAETVEIELTLNAGADPAATVKALYAYTGCETTVSSHIVVIHKGHPVEMTVPDILRENTRQLEETLQLELMHRRDQLGEEINAKTLVEIFVEERIYKRIEECKTAEAVRQAVLEGFEPFKKRLRRPITDEDVEMLLGIRIRRISRFDLEKNHRDIEKLLEELATVEKNLASLRRYVISYLRGLLKTYGKDYPRHTKITSFDQVKIKELAAGEFDIAYDRESGYLGYQTEGEALLACSRYDKLLLVWSDGRYKVIKPPEKLFVDKDMIYCAVADRDHVFTMAYKHDLFVFLKRFTFGGSITDRDYRCAADPATVLLFEEGTPKDIFVKYKPSKRQRIHQQHFNPEDVAVKGVKAMGNHMTGKAISKIATTQPRWWKEDEASPRGRFS
ncbi:MAG: DNA topoisomerase IV subunit A [Lentisphaerae bacterium]|nr:DNA topoisomerase IV subunit A [Lentisphaerota bacterium]